MANHEPLAKHVFAWGALSFSKIIVIFIKIDYLLIISFANSELVAAKEKLEIVIGAAHFDFAQYKPSPFRIFEGGFFRQNAFWLIQEYSTHLC